MRKIINVILSLIIIMSLGVIIYKNYQYKSDEKLYSEIQNYKPVVLNLENEDIKKENVEEKKVNLEEEKLINMNNDYKFWININNTNVDYPVVQYSDNDFYLKHDFNKEYSISGTLFIDYRNNINEDKNIIIYGHNMKNKTMFNNINEFKDEDFFNNSNITIIKGNKEYKYEVFSVYITPENEAMLKTSFKDSNEYLKYLDTLVDKSLYKKNIELNDDTKIITLITCSYEYDNARTLVHGKLVP